MQCSLCVWAVARGGHVSGYFEAERQSQRPVYPHGSHQWGAMLVMVLNFQHPDLKVCGSFSVPLVTCSSSSAS